MNLRPASFAILSGALMLVGSSMAFANPDQTNPRESAPTATVSQDTSVGSGSSSSTTVSNPFITESQHDARKDRNRNGNEK